MTCTERIYVDRPDEVDQPTGRLIRAAIRIDLDYEGMDEWDISLQRTDRHMLFALDEVPDNGVVTIGIGARRMLAPEAINLLNAQKDRLHITIEGAWAHSVTEAVSRANQGRRC